jgi:hypothetical protein
MLVVFAARWASSTARRRRGNGRHAVVFGHPEAVVPQLLGADRRRRGGGQRVADSTADTHPS